MSSDDTIVKVTDLFFEYEGGVKAIENVSFEVKAGEFLAVMGPNGAGKTTLCHILSGVIPAIYGGKRKGEVQVCGIDPWKTPIYEMAKYVGLVMQDPETQLVMPNVGMELAFGPASLGVPRDEIVKRIKKVLKIVGLEGYEDRHPKDLSGGQKQRVAIGAVLTMMPKLLILDEPTSQLDPLGTREVLEALQTLRKQGKITIFMTTHKTSEIATLCDKILILDGGKVVACGEPHKVLANPDMLEKIGVKPPAVSLLFRKLSSSLSGNLKQPLTVHEAYSIIKKLIDNKKVKVKKDASFMKKYEEKKIPIIQIEDLTFVYPGHPPVKALKHISLNIYEGEFIGIIGQNGSGKTTLVKNIIGLLRPTEGKITFKGEDVSKFTVGELAKRIGLVLQNPDFQLFTISCAKEIEFSLRNIGVPADDIEQRVMDALKMVGLEKEHEIFPFRLSFGDRRKLAVAAIAAMNPEVLILDEPTTAQDYRGRYSLADLAKKMHDEKGVTVIMITHDMDLVAKYTDRVIVMWNGEILADGPTREVFQQQAVLSKAFLKPPEITQLSLMLGEYGVPGGILSVEEMLEVLEPVGDVCGNGVY